MGMGDSSPKSFYFNLTHIIVALYQYLCLNIIYKLIMLIYNKLQILSFLQMIDIKSYIEKYAKNKSIVKWK
jgi:hypothetical protein